MYFLNVLTLYTYTHILVYVRDIVLSLTHTHILLSQICISALCVVYVVCAYASVRMCLFVCAHERVRVCMCVCTYTCKKILL